MASRSIISPEFSEGSLRGEGARAGVYKRTSRNGPPPSTVSFAIGVLGGAEMWIYPLSPLSNVLAAGIP